MKKQRNKGRIERKREREGQRLFSFSLSTCRNSAPKGKTIRQRVQWILDQNQSRNTHERSRKVEQPERIAKTKSETGEEKA